MDNAEALAATLSTMNAALVELRDSFAAIANAPSDPRWPERHERERAAWAVKVCNRGLGDGD